MRLFKVHARARGIGYREALDEALCYGWIDGVRRSLDEDSFTQRFTPRKKKSNWSAVNVRRVEELTKKRRMRAAGLKAFRERREDKTATYSYEQRHSVELPAAFEKRFRAKEEAWSWFQAQPDGYRATARYWVMSAKKPETRERRLATLIEDSAKGRRVPPLRPRTGKP